MTSMPRASAAAISASLVVPQSTVTMTVAPAASAASIAASDRPWPSSSRLGTYGSTVDARTGAGRATGSPGRSARRRRSRRRPGPARPRSRAAVSRVEQDGRRRAGSARVVEAVERIGEPGVERRRGRSTPRRARSPVSAVGEARARRPPSRGRRDASTGSGKIQRKRGSTTSLRMPRAAAPRLYAAGRRRGRQDAVRRTRGARVAASRPCRRSSQSCQSTSSGLATKIDE